MVIKDYYDEVCYYDELYHHGVKGMKWGVRKDKKSGGSGKTKNSKYVNDDGSLTKTGQKCKAAAVKYFKNTRSAYQNRVKQTEEYIQINQNALKESRAYDKQNGGTSWQTQALVDATKAIRQEHSNAKLGVAMADAHIKAFENDTLKVGQDYMSDKRRKVRLTESGEAKLNDITNRVKKTFE